MVDSPYGRGAGHESTTSNLNADRRGAPLLVLVAGASPPIPVSRAEGNMRGERRPGTDLFPGMTSTVFLQDGDQVVKTEAHPKGLSK